jgi:hypothetical protein
LSSPDCTEWQLAFPLLPCPATATLQPALLALCCPRPFKDIPLSQANGLHLSASPISLFSCIRRASHPAARFVPLCSRARSGHTPCHAATFVPQDWPFTTCQPHPLPLHLSGSSLCP